MSNEAWLRKFLNWDQYEQKKRDSANRKSHCDNFVRGNDGYCKHYMGYKTVESSCIRGCALDNDNK